MNQAKLKSQPRGVAAPAPRVDGKSYSQAVSQSQTKNPATSDTRSTHQGDNLINDNHPPRLDNSNHHPVLAAAQQGCQSVVLVNPVTITELVARITTVLLVNITHVDPMKIATEICNLTHYICNVRPEPRLIANAINPDNCCLYD